MENGTDAPERFMFVTLSRRHRPGLRWACPLLFALLWLAFLWYSTRALPAQQAMLQAWGALDGGPGARIDLHAVLRLFTALFLHADWAHLLGNLVFLLIFGLPAEKAMGSWRLLLLFLLGGAVANLAAVLLLADGRMIIGASGAISALIGAYLMLFPRARLGVVLPLGLFLQIVRAPASLLIGIWALLQVVFAYIGPAFGMVAWAAHVAGFLFGIVFAVLVRRAVARRLRRQKGL